MEEAWKIVPQRSIGPLSLGMEEGEYVALLGLPSKVFRRTSDASHEIIAFDNALVHLTVDSKRCVVGISVFKPRQVFFAGVQLLGQPMKVVYDDLKLAGLDFVPVDAGLWCKQAGVVLVEVDGAIDGVELTN